MKNKKSICIGLLAHVDAGKTTLSEAILYRTGEIRKLGRVDHGDSYLDNNEMERNRGITVFSKTAAFTAGETDVTVLDTPGHVDFSAEMERVLSVIDYALLIISASEGVQSHTETLWRLLKDRNIPVIVYFNKMDLAVRDKHALIGELEQRFGAGFVDFSSGCSGEQFIDDITLHSPALADLVLADRHPSDADISAAIASREIFPCCFGSALKMEGIDELLDCLDRFTVENEDYQGQEFGARIFKVQRDHNDERLTFMRLTGGSLKSRETISGIDANGESWTEKINNIRIYSGMKFAQAEEVSAGQVCAVTGLTHTLPGAVLGTAVAAASEELEPIVMHSVVSAVDANGNTPDVTTLLRTFRQLGEEDPKLHIAWDESTQEITLRMMGEMQLEILQQLVLDRYGYRVEFGPARVVYLETINKTIEGAGHFEPLRHYAEVHLILEPAERGSGITLDSIVPEDVLARNWQRLILTHLEEKEHIGTLIGAPITDMKITLAAGRAHDKHTNGGDFREATYRALRQGLMQARADGAAVLLEPFTDFRIEVKSDQIGRIMTDLEQFADIGAINQTGETATLEGCASSAALTAYMPTFTAVTGGQGHVALRQAGYKECKNSEQVISETGYNPERDINNPADSVFVSHSESDIVNWKDAMKKMHIPPVLKEGGIAETSRSVADTARREAYRKALATDDELKAIFDRTFGSNKQSRHKWATEHHFTRDAADKNYERNAEIKQRHTHSNTSATQLEDSAIYLIDGYNLVNCDPELSDLAHTDINAAREALIDRLVHYQGFTGNEVVVVFDAYKRVDYNGEEEKRLGVRVVYTATDEPADIRMGLMAANYGKHKRIRIVSSDALVQQNALVNNALRVPSSEFLAELVGVENEIRDLLY